MILHCTINVNWTIEITWYDIIWFLVLDNLNHTFQAIKLFQFVLISLYELKSCKNYKRTSINCIYLKLYLVHRYSCNSAVFLEHFFNIYFHHLKSIEVPDKNPKNVNVIFHQWLIPNNCWQRKSYRENVDGEWLMMKD